MSIELQILSLVCPCGILCIWIGLIYWAWKAPLSGRLAPVVAIVLMSLHVARWGPRLVTPMRVVLFGERDCAKVTNVWTPGPGPVVVVSYVLSIDGNMVRNDDGQLERDAIDDPWCESKHIAVYYLRDEPPVVRPVYPVYETHALRARLLGLFISMLGVGGVVGARVLRRRRTVALKARSTIKSEAE